MGACARVSGWVGRRDRIREARGRGRWCRASNDSWINVHVYVLLASPISIGKKKNEFTFPNQTAQPDYTHNTGYINFNMHRFLLSGRLQQTSGRPARAEACTMRVPWPDGRRFNSIQQAAALGISKTRYILIVECISQYRHRPIHDPAGVANHME